MRARGLYKPRMTQFCNRREMLKRTGQFVIAGAIGSAFASGAQPEIGDSPGLVAGQPKAAEVGNKILREGGNAIDAAVAAALVAGVTVPNGCGIGGYGGHMMLALKGGRKITAIDFNTAAPAVARPDMFVLDDNGVVRGRVNEFGWLAAGVPGTLAGLQFALDRYGTRRLRDVIKPAIGFAQDGFPVTEGLARAVRATANQLRKDPGSVKLLFKDGEPLQAGDTFRNPDLAKMLEALATENTVEPFYRGDIARRIAAEFQKHGGLVTAKDMAEYKAREVQPLKLDWRGFSIRTAPLTAGGISILQALSILKALDWDNLPESTRRTHVQIEALRLAWSDRLALLGDPQKVKVPIDRLLSEKYARELSSKIQLAVTDGKPLPLKIRSRAQAGTIHLNSVDRHGNMVALTMTHGNTFGACVTVDGLGLMLGHGMSRFDPQPEHPNSPAPRKRPLHNMCPTIVLRDGKPLLALGATGGRMIPNTIFSILTQFIGLNASIEDAIAAPRLHTDGNLDLTLERKWSETEADALKNIGYAVKLGPSANAHAILVDPKTGGARYSAR
jgi:gamma-glutamyltranspeptidase/glutathione hydrolase